MTAALHAGYFLMRQIAPKGGTVANRFHKRVLAFRHAKATTGACNARLYHLCGKSLYRALEQENNRHRRAHNPFHVRAKLIGLDYVLEHPAFDFLPTEQGKVAFFDSLKISRAFFPTRTYTGKDGETDRYFIDKYPVRIDPATRQVSFCFVDDGAYSEMSFDAWLTNYTPLIKAIPGAQVVFVSDNPGRFKRANKTFSQRFILPHAVLDAGQLIAYFEMRKAIDKAGYSGKTQAEMDTWKRLRKTFTGARFDDQYAAWLRGIAPEPETPAVLFSTYHANHVYGVIA